MNIRNLEIFQAATAIVGIPVLLTTLYFDLAKSDCDIEDYHIHRFINDDTSLVRYIDSEMKTTSDGYIRTNEYKVVDEADKELIDFENKNKLIKIDDNLEMITEKTKNKEDFIEYKYEYYRWKNFGKYYHVVSKYTWSQNPPVDTGTGEERICRNAYQGYKIEKDDKGKYTLIPSNYVDNLLDIKDEYPYIKEDFIKVMDVATGREADYEDGAPTNDDLKITNREIGHKK